MNWLKKIFQGIEKENNTKSLSFSDVNTWLDDRSDYSEFEASLRNSFNMIEELAKELNNNIEALGSAVPDDSIPPKLLRAGLAARTEVVKQMDSFTKKLTPPAKMDIESAAAYHWTIVRGLERTMTTFSQAQRYVTALFPQEARSINSDLTRLSHLLVQMENEISERRRELEEIWYSRELVTKVQDEAARIHDLKHIAETDELKLAKLLESQKSREGELKKFEASDEGKRAEELKKSLDLKRVTLKEIEAKIADLIVPLNKALIRIVKQEESDRLILQHKNTFTLLCTSTYQALDNDINGALRELGANIAALGLREKKREKILEHIDLLINRKPLEVLKSKHSALHSEITNLENELSECSYEVALLKEDMSRARKEIRNFEAKRDQNLQALASLEKEADDDGAELKKRLEKLAGRPVQIDMTFQET